MARSLKLKSSLHRYATSKLNFSRCIHRPFYNSQLQSIDADYSHRSTVTKLLMINWAQSTARHTDLWVCLIYCIAYSFLIKLKYLAVIWGYVSSVHILWTSTVPLSTDFWKLATTCCSYQRLRGHLPHRRKWSLHNVSIKQLSVWKPTFWIDKGNSRHYLSNVSWFHE